MAAEIELDVKLLKKKDELVEAVYDAKVKSEGFVEIIGILVAAGNLTHALTNHVANRVMNELGCTPIGYAISYFIQQATIHALKQYQASV